MVYHLIKFSFAETGETKLSRVTLWVETASKCGFQIVTPRKNVLAFGRLSVCSHRKGPDSWQLAIGSIYMSGQLDPYSRAINQRSGLISCLPS